MRRSEHPPDNSLQNGLRQAAAEHLTAQLARNARLMAQCEDLAGGKPGDKVGALNAASRLMRADAALVAQLSRIAGVESVHRSITQTLPPVGLNSNFSQEPTLEEREKIYKHLNEIVNMAVARRMGDSKAEDRIARVLREIEEEKARRDARRQ